MHLIEKWIVNNSTSVFMHISCVADNLQFKDTDRFGKKSLGLVPCVQITFRKPAAGVGQGREEEGRNRGLWGRWGRAWAEADRACCGQAPLPPLSTAWTGGWWPCAEPSSWERTPQIPRRGFRERACPRAQAKPDGGWTCSGPRRRRLATGKARLAV